jgi:alkylation response protein AidB-like acyl-CoA dehydrogenase
LSGGEDAVQLSDSEHGAVFRRQVAAFVASHWSEAKDASPDDITAFRRAAIEAGYLYRAIPRRFGGSEQPADPIRAQIIREEFGKAHAPMEVEGNGMNMLVPTLLERGTEAQCERFIPPTAEGRYGWAQGYSEPEAGSDLASLRTTARLEGDEWVINGAKTWTSHAAKADYMFALVRTEPDRPKHEGISYLLLDLKQPGVTIRPFREMTGQARFAEVVFENARTPADWIVGARGEGWQVSRTTLKHERASIGAARKTEELLAKLIALASKPDAVGCRAIDDAAVRQKIMILQGWVLAQKYTGYRQLSLSAAGRTEQMLALTGKLLTTEIGHMVASLAQDLIGLSALQQPAVPGSGEPRGDEKWLDQIMGSLGVSIAGGTSNIQRDIIAERGLGLPRQVAAA